MPSCATVLWSQLNGVHAGADSFTRFRMHRLGRGHTTQEVLHLFLQWRLLRFPAAVIAVLLASATRDDSHLERCWPGTGCSRRHASNMANSGCNANLLFHTTNVRILRQLWFHDSACQLSSHAFWRRCSSISGLVHVLWLWFHGARLFDPLTLFVLCAGAGRSVQELSLIHI